LRPEVEERVIFAVPPVARRNQLIVETAHNGSHAFEA
jgi:hypothetical protein